MVELHSKPPSITVVDFLRLMPSGIASAGAHAASVLSLTAGGVAFGQVRVIDRDAPKSFL
jgi:hypothetical protein